MPARLSSFSLPAHSYSDPVSSSSNTRPSETRNLTLKASRDKPPSSAMDSLKRHSLAAIGKSKDKENRGASPSPTTPRSVKNVTGLEIKIESPPALFHGNASQSTGALYAGQLVLKVTEPEVTLSSFTMRFVAVSTMRKPVARDCSECASKTAELKEWTFITKPKQYQTGTHAVPFSYLIPGHLPITTWGDLGRIQYYLDAKAVLVPTSKPHSPTSPQGEIPLAVRREVHISRALKPLEDKVSIRIFPPTNLAARVTYEPIIHPIGDYNFQMVLSGITDKSQKDIQTRWRLRKLLWRLEETEKMVSPACPRHAAKVGGPGKGIGHEDTRNVGRDEIKSGWKTDISDGSIAMEFSVRPSASPRPLCDVDSPNGLVVTHSLVIELIIAEEWAPNKTPERATPTGAARVLRMQFAMMVTERAGMGISWDEEMPPMYEDVPASPPMYPKAVIGDETPEMQRTQSQIINYTGTPLGPPPPFTEEAADLSGLDADGGDFEGLTLGPSRFAPRPRSREGQSGSSESASASSSHRPTALRTSSPDLTHPVAGHRQAQTPTSLRGRHRLDVEDFLTDEQERDLRRAEEEREQERERQAHEPEVERGSVD